jgi:hypothetical protein
MERRSGALAWQTKSNTLLREILRQFVRFAARKQRLIDAQNGLIAF